MKRRRNTTRRYADDAEYYPSFLEMAVAAIIATVGFGASAWICVEIWSWIWS